jgi:hypothetical protein
MTLLAPDAKRVPTSNGGATADNVVSGAQ